MPTMPMTGVGLMPGRRSHYRTIRCRPLPAFRMPCTASLIPAIVSLNCHITSGPFGRTEVQTVGERQGPGSTRNKVATGFGNHKSRAGSRIGLAVPSVRVESHCKRAPCLLDPNHRRVRTRAA